MLRRVLLFIVIAVLMPTGAWAKPEKLQLKAFVDFVPPTVSPEGFVDGADKWLLDSVRDVQDAFDDKEFYPKKGWPGSKAKYQLARTAEEADVVVTVAARGISMQAFGQRTTMQVYRNVVLADSVPTVGVTRWVSVVLSVGTYRKELVAWHTNQSRWSVGAWKADAKLLSIMVAGWVMANEAQILERRKARNGGM